jgi:hypothetical protein
MLSDESDTTLADMFARILSIIDTAVKNGQEMFGVLECLAKCKST